MLALPALLMLITSKIHERPPFPAPGIFFNRVMRRLDKAHLPLTPSQSTSLRAIIGEEFSKASADWPEAVPGELSENFIARRKERIDAWNQTLLDRAQGAIDSKQYEEYQRAQRFEYNEIVREAGQPRWDASNAFYHVLVDFYFFLILPLICVRSCGALIRDELRADTMGFLITRPVRRAGLIVAKYLSQAGWLYAMFLVETILLFAAGGYRHLPYLGRLLPLFPRRANPGRHCLVRTRAAARPS